MQGLTITWNPFCFKRVEWMGSRNDNLVSGMSKSTFTSEHFNFSYSWQKTNNIIFQL